MQVEIYCLSRDQSHMARPLPPRQSLPLPAGLSIKVSSGLEEAQPDYLACYLEVREAFTWF